MNDDIDIRVRNVSITYTTYAKSQSRYRSRYRQPITAIDNVSFDIRRGETVGFVGRNGAGKSTLLKAIAGVCNPSSGEILVREQPQLLGVSAALVARVDGYTNIGLGLLSLGFAKDQVPAMTPAIAEFTDLGPALHRPIKTYSSGMRARLAFAIATSAQPRILLLDEALSVGDLHFKHRSLRRLNEIRRNAGTILLASHNTSEIHRACTRVIWMVDGAIVADGPVDDVLPAFVEAQEDEEEGANWSGFSANGHDASYQVDEDSYLE